MASHLVSQHADGSKSSTIQVETKRVATGNILAGLTNPITVTFDTPFPDTNFTLSCSMEGAASVFLLDSITSKLAGGCVVGVKNISIGTNSGTLHVTAIAD